MKYQMKKNYSLFIGRYSPPHLGHKALFEKVLCKGKNVCIAIRDTEKSSRDPYSYRNRKKHLKAMLKKYKELVKIIKIPDIDEVCYGRDVGWEIRKINLDKKTEAISATKIRDNS